jgi:membrane protease YdiL (CAAX protease family)
MTARVRSARWVRAHPLAAFYVLAFGITWLGWLPQTAHSRGFFPVDSPLFYVLGGVGPGIAAWVVLRVLHGKDGDALVFGPLLRWRVGVVWLAVALLLPAALWLVVAGTSGRLGKGLEGLDAWPGILAVFLVYLAQAVPEEVGWRGFALRHLQSRSSALAASLVVGVLWGLWHVPLLMNADNVMSTYPVVPWFIGVVASSVLFSWLFNSTRGSVLVVTVFHASGNTVGGLSAGYLATEAAVVGVLAVLIVALFGASRLSRLAGRGTEGARWG